MPEAMHYAQHISSGFRTVSVSTASTLLVSPSPDRALLVICPPSAGTLTISTGVSVVADAGINLQVGDTPMILNIHNSYDLPFRGWQAIMSAGTATIGVFEGMYTGHGPDES
tara:strand:- start:154 stop:489 length:336 start_codon:yes stop_codon:yes gene_type:complete